MAAVLIWLAEQIGGAVLKHWVEGLFGRKAAPSDPKIVAEASRAQATAAQAQQVAQAATDRAKVDERIVQEGADAARADMAEHWNEP